MISAFGVDHGEISKRGGPAGARKLFRRAPRGPNGKRLNPQQIRSQQGTPKPGPVEQTKAAAHSLGEADISPKGIGRAASKPVMGFGRFVEAHPGLTGAAVLGGAGAGTYGVASGVERRRQKKS